jgi:hypothetical protein
MGTIRTGQPSPWPTIFLSLAGLFVSIREGVPAIVGPFRGCGAINEVAVRFFEIDTVVALGMLTWSYLLVGFTVSVLQGLREVIECRDEDQ